MIRLKQLLLPLVRQQHVMARVSGVWLHVAATFSALGHTPWSAPTIVITIRFSSQSSSSIFPSFAITNVIVCVCVWLFCRQTDNPAEALTPNFQPPKIRQSEIRQSLPTPCQPRQLCRRNLVSLSLSGPALETGNSRSFSLRHVVSNDAIKTRPLRLLQYRTFPATTSSRSPVVTSQITSYNHLYGSTSISCEMEKKKKY